LINFGRKREREREREREGEREREKERARKRESGKRMREDRGCTSKDATTFSIMTLIITAICLTIKRVTQHKGTRFCVMLW
jgi:hypothetical protein